MLGIALTKNYRTRSRPTTPTPDRTCPYHDPIDTLPEEGRLWQTSADQALAMARAGERPRGAAPPPRRSRPGRPGGGSGLDQEGSGRLRNGVDRTIVVLVETPASARMRPSSDSRSPGVPTRTLRM